MANETDFSPVDYLKRRIIYYKKKRGSARNYIKMEHLIKKYGQNKLKLFVGRIVHNYEKRIKEYENAIKKLEQ